MKSTALRSKLVARKLQRKRVGFKAKAPAGYVFYKNSNAKPIVKGDYFKLENVEYLSSRDLLREPWMRRYVTSQRSSIHIGTVKFKGLKPKPVVLKNYKNPSKKLADHLTNIVDRLSKSKAAHPKMSVLYYEKEGKPVVNLLMDSYVRKELVEVFSKFDTYQRTVDSLKLHRQRDRELFNSVLDETAKLARVGLVVPYTLGVSVDLINAGLSKEELLKHAHPQIDAFTKMERKEGDARLPKVMVQDIDEMEIASTPLEAWNRSIKNITTVVGPNNPMKKELLISMIEEARLRNKF